MNPPAQQILLGTILASSPTHISVNHCAIRDQSSKLNSPGIFITQEQQSNSLNYESLELAGWDSQGSAGQC